MIEPGRGTILLTGASGSLGRAIALRLADGGHSLLLQHHSHPVDLPARQGFAAVSLDLTDDARTQGVLELCRPTAIIHTAAATDVDWCEDHPEEAFSANVEATARLARWAAGHGSPFIYTSTDLVFDGREPPYDEDALVNPLSHYARTKEEGECETRAAGGHSLVLRVALLYGRGSAHKGTFLDFLLRRLERGERTSLFADQFRTPALLGDVARVVEQALATGATGLYHLGGPDRVSRVAFGETVCRVFGHDTGCIAPSSYLEHGFRGNRPADVSLTSSRVARELGVEFRSLEEGLALVREERLGTLSRGRD